MWLIPTFICFNANDLFVKSFNKKRAGFIACRTAATTGFDRFDNRAIQLLGHTHLIDKLRKRQDCGAGTVPVLASSFTAVESGCSVARVAWTVVTCELLLRPGVVAFNL